MDRPLWQTLLGIFVVGLAVRSAAVAYVCFHSDVGAELLGPAYAAQAVAAAVTALGLFLGRRFVLAALVLLGITVAGIAILEGFVLGVQPALFALSQVLVAALATAALFYVLDRELGSPADRRALGIRDDPRPARRRL